MKQYHVMAIMLAATLFAAGTSAARADGETYTAQGSKVEVKLVPDKSTILTGEPIHVGFTVVNLSDQNLQVIVGEERMQSASNRTRFRFEAVRSDGLKVNPPPLPDGIGGNCFVGPKDLRAHRSYTFDLFLPRLLPLKLPGKYVLSCSKMLEIVKPLPDGGWDPHAKPDEIETRASADLTILPPDPRAMGRVIESLGYTANMDFGNNGNLEDVADRATESLAEIQDVRAIPWLVKLFEKRSSTRKTQALYALGKFDSPVAFAAIKAGLTVRGSDFDNCTTPQVAADAARNVRLDAVRALSASPYPKALPLLLSLRHDPEESVRLWIVHTMGSRETAGTTAILREMTHDPSQMIRDEAARYLQLRQD